MHIKLFYQAQFATLLIRKKTKKTNKQKKTNNKNYQKYAFTK